MSIEQLFVEQCKDILPYPAFGIFVMIFIAFKQNQISECEADRSVLYILDNFPDLKEQYNEIVKESACRKASGEVDLF